MRLAIAGYAALIWVCISAFAVASIDRYSPVWSWQTLVVFGGAAVVFAITSKKNA